MNPWSALGRLGRGVGLTISNNGRNSISANETGNRVSKFSAADTTRPPRRSKTHSIERKSIPVLPTVMARGRHTTGHPQIDFLQLRSGI